MTDIWTYSPDLELPTSDLTGFTVETSDGDEIGKVDEAGTNGTTAFVVVDTGGWILGKKRLIPGRAIRQINADAEKVFVSLTKEQVKGAPDAEQGSSDDRKVDQEARDIMSDYYLPHIL